MFLTEEEVIEIIKKTKTKTRKTQKELDKIDESEVDISTELIEELFDQNMEVYDDLKEEGKLSKPERDKLEKIEKFLYHQPESYPPSKKDKALFEQRKKYEKANYKELELILYNGKVYVKKLSKKNV